jgi:hypothetical protein
MMLAPRIDEKYRALHAAWPVTQPDAFYTIHRREWRRHDSRRSLTRSTVSWI